MNKTELLEKIAAATTATKITDLVDPVDDLDDDEVTLSFCDKIKSIASVTTDPKDFKLLIENFVKGNLGNTSTDADNEIRKVIILQFITTVSTAAEIITIVDPVDDLDDDEVTLSFCDRVKSIATIITDREDLNIFRIYFVNGNLCVTKAYQDNEIRKVIIPKLIVAATNINDLEEIEDAVDNLNDHEINTAYDQKKASIK